MLYTIDLNGHAGAHVASDPAGRGFLLCLHFARAEDASHAQETLKPAESPASYPTVSVPPPPEPTPPPLGPGQVAVDPVTNVVKRAGPDLQDLVGKKVRMVDGKFVLDEPAPASAAPVPDGMDAATHAFIQNLPTAPEPVPALPPVTVAPKPATPPVRTLADYLGEG